jgi:hypothetical protein
MIRFFTSLGETEELRIAGRHVYENFPRLMELSVAMQSARSLCSKNGNSKG